MSVTSYALDEIQSKSLTYARKGTSSCWYSVKKSSSSPVRDIRHKRRCPTFIDAAKRERSASPETTEQIKCTTASDPQLRHFLDYAVSGWPKYAKAVPEEIRQYHAVTLGSGWQDHYHNRLVIPSSLQSEVLERIHLGHHGMTRCHERANVSIWWHSISRDIQSKVSDCEFCQENIPRQRKEPLITTSLPERAWKKIGADLCEHQGKQFLVIPWNCLRVQYYQRCCNR